MINTVQKYYVKISMFSAKKIVKDQIFSELKGTSKIYIEMIFISNGYIAAKPEEWLLFF